MTETTNTVNQDSSSADLAPKDDVKGFIQVYKSTDENPCEVWFAPRDAEIIRPYTQIPPDASLKKPKFDFVNYKWFDMDEATQAQKLSDMADTIKKLKDDVDNGTASKEDIDNINEQLGTLVGLISSGIVPGQDEDVTKGSDK